MTDIVFAGPRGSGKTLKVVDLAIKGHNSGYLIVSNIDSLTVPHVKFNINVIYQAIKNKISLTEIYRSKKIIMALDELTMLGDSHRSLSTEVTILSYMFMQARKNGIHLFGTVQIYGRLDKTIRLMVDTKVKCMATGPRKDPTTFIYKYVKRFRGQTYFKLWHKKDFEKYFANYDTNEPIYPELIEKK